VNKETKTKKLYIAGMGMVTPVGGNVAMTAAMVGAGVSAYKASDFYNKENQRITMASVPNILFDEVKATIGEGDRFNAQHDRVTKMAIIAIREACSYQKIDQPIPLLLAQPDKQMKLEGLSPLIQELENNCEPLVSPQLTRSIHSGRAAGIDALAFAFRYLYEGQHDFILVGGSDSYYDDALLEPLDNYGRLLTVGSPDSFAPGEAACFLLLTCHPELAQQRKGHIIALNPPGIADEPGHLYSEEPYRGDGLDQAFKQALINQPDRQIHSIYSSMNGENYWAKEFGVAQIRNKQFFQDPVKIQHPADCYGDLGSATATTLIALAVEHLFNTKAQAHLVYSSSDGATRGAIVVEKIAVAGPENNNAHKERS
jgi:3-oxoacyl-[acyl-carrier-protein] synthase-1